jgi:hypothetical protein
MVNSNLDLFFFSQPSSYPMSSAAAFLSREQQLHEEDASTIAGGSRMDRSGGIGGFRRNVGYRVAAHDNLFDRGGGGGGSEDSIVVDDTLTQTGLCDRQIKAFILQFYVGTSTF